MRRRTINAHWRGTANFVSKAQHKAYGADGRHEQATQTYRSKAGSIGRLFDSGKKAMSSTVRRRVDRRTTAKANKVAATHTGTSAYKTKTEMQATDLTRRIRTHPRLPSISSADNRSDEPASHTPKVRKCLNCGESFKSAWYGNRLCQRCGKRHHPGTFTT